jgi:UDP-perosamine 4-acetyltransferase
MMKKKEDIIILGTGGHSKVVIDIIEAGDLYNIIGITDASIDETTLYRGYPILGNDDVLLDYLKKGVTNVAIGVGGFRNNNNRKRIFNKVKLMGYNIPVLIHPSAVISNSVVLKEGSVIFSGVNINTDVTIGENNIIATGANIDHDTILRDHVLISAGVTIGGNVEIANEVLCALGSNIISGVKINEKIVVGAGAVVVNNLLENGTYIGCPAKLMKK